MRNYRLKLLHLALAPMLLFAFGVATPAQAHGGPPRVELGAQRASPGAELTVFGINLGADLPIAIGLVGDATYPLGVATCDEQGDFQAVFTLPAGMRVGTYTLQATAPDKSVVTAQIEIESASAAMLRGWLTSLQNAPFELLLATLAVIFSTVAIALWWRDRRKSHSL